MMARIALHLRCAGTARAVNTSASRCAILALTHINLAKGRPGQGPSHLLSALLTASFAQAAEERASIPESERRDFTVYVDEYQNFAAESFATILSEAREWRLNLVPAQSVSGFSHRCHHRFDRR
jgi:hypothetical protein